MIDPEMRRAHALPAMVANRFHLTLGGDVMRIAIGEQVTPESETIYHQAVVLRRADALALAEMILHLARVATHEDGRIEVSAPKH